MHLKALVAIKLYKEEIKKNPDTWLTYCKNQNNLSDAIYFAAISENHLGKRHSHQYRLKKMDMLIFAEKLKSHEIQIKNAETFDVLFKLIQNIGFKLNGIGEMLIYDAAERIGLFLNLFPDKIYLHAGTRIGAEKMLGKINSNTISKAKLPEPFKSSNLSCTEIEDILCMYKNRL
jgi:hypothetical protein